MVFLPKKEGRPDPFERLVEQLYWWSLFTLPAGPRFFLPGLPAGFLPAYQAFNRPGPATLEQSAAWRGKVLAVFQPEAGVARINLEMPGGLVYNFGEARQV